MDLAERNEQIVEMSKTMSYERVAAELGLTRGVVSGVVHRFGAQPGHRGKVSAVVGKKPRQPARFAAPKVKAPVERAPAQITPAVALDVEGHTAAVRAVFLAEPSTCRFVLGAGWQEFAFCGARATVAAGGALTYCRPCWARMRQPKDKPVVVRAKETIRCIKG